MAASSSVAQSADWLTYHHDLARTGVAPGPAVAPSARSQWESPALDGDVYAEPLLVGDRLLVATESDSLYALDRADGHVLWRTNLGQPVPRGALPCGNIDPVGITGTPTVDPATGLLYAVAFLQPLHHELYALDVATGAVRFHQPIDPPGADPRVHLQRAALALSGGIVYVAFGGRFGDCGNYHGWVVAARAADGTRLAAYQVPTEREGGIWAPAGPTIDANGQLFVATGNGSSGGDFDYGNSVVRLSPDLKPLDWFAPTDWKVLNERDLDLGSTSPALLDGGLVFQVGKAGVGYLLRADHLGGIGGAVFTASVCSGGGYGGTAYAAPYLYVPCRSGLVALRVDGGRFSIAWSGPRFNAGPPVIAGDAVWTVDQSDGTLYAFGAQDGAQRARLAPSQPIASLPHFLTPTIAAGRVYVSHGRTIAAYG